MNESMNETRRKEIRKGSWSEDAVHPSPNEKRGEETKETAMRINARGKMKETRRTRKARKLSLSITLFHSLHSLHLLPLPIILPFSLSVASSFSSELGANQSRIESSVMFCEQQGTGRSVLGILFLSITIWFSPSPSATPAHSLRLLLSPSLSLSRFFSLSLSLCCMGNEQTRAGSKAT